MTWGRSGSHDACVAWARQLPTDVAVSPAEVQARLIIEDHRLLGALSRGWEKSRTAPAPDENRDSADEASELDGPGIARWRRRASAAWRRVKLAVIIAIIVMPLLGLLFVPSWRTPDSVSRARFEILIPLVTATFAVTAVLNLLMLAIWAVRPLAGGGGCLRAIQMQITVIAAVALTPYLGLLFLATLGERGGWPLLMMALAVLTAFLSFQAETSTRSTRHATAAMVREVARTVGEDPDLKGEHGGPRGPVRELRRARRRLPQDDLDELERCRADVLRALVERHLMDTEVARRAAAVPFERMHLTGSMAGP
ncbi:hypothetical protein [Brachybacterium epidermidis]|uniref:hypothetical protein n=1 Tax=Brachybacterium epidermidis TaxID=2781983 RepID=UPI00398E870E